MGGDYATVLQVVPVAVRGAFMAGFAGNDVGSAWMPWSSAAERSSGVADHSLRVLSTPLGDVGFGFGSVGLVARKRP